MLLTYSIESFVEDIKNGVKIHSIRADPHNRWKAGRTIQHWKGNPRNVKNNPYYFQNDVCVSVQKIKILKFNLPAFDIPIVHIYIDDRELNAIERIILAKNDGFKCFADFINFFFKNDSEGELNRRLIHWTDKKY